MFEFSIFPGVAHAHLCVFVSIYECDAALGEVIIVVYFCRRKMSVRLEQQRRWFAAAHAVCLVLCWLALGSQVCDAATNRCLKRMS